MSHSFASLEQLSLGPGNSLHPIPWIPPATRSLVDVGCNVGQLLEAARVTYPGLRLAGLDVNAAAVDRARMLLPDADLHAGAADHLPFADESFDCATCIEVLEHVPAPLRSTAFREIRRILRPGGICILRVPHAGAFAWLDANNLRFRFPRLYGALIGRGRRDEGYEGSGESVVWHHHFTRAELEALAGQGWTVEAVRMGGLFLFPLMDLLSWPFYRLRRTDSRVFGLLQRLAAFDLNRDFGRRSFGILMVLRRT